MSLAGKSFGTQSPPLEATPGGEEPMGVSSIRGDRPHGVPDRVQRQEYFKDEWTNAGAQTTTPKDVAGERMQGKAKQD